MTGVINGARKGAMALGPKEAVIRAQREANAIAAEKSSRGGGGARPAVKRRTVDNRKGDTSGKSAEGLCVAGTLGEPAAAVTRGEKMKGPQGANSLPATHGGPRRSGGSERHLAGVAPGPREDKPKRGRPRIEDRDKPKPPKPWETAGMSRRSWYRRKAEARWK